MTYLTNLSIKLKTIVIWNGYRVEQMEIRPQTKVMDPMVCTTRDGVKNVFRDIQVISSISKDKVGAKTAIALL